MANLSPQQLKHFEEHASDNKQPNLIATIILCLLLACIGVLLRFLARWRNKASFKADDWLILAALIPLAGMTTTTGLTVRYGEGKHIIFVTSAAGFSKAYIAGIVVYALTVIPTKLSVLYLYHRIFPSKPLVILACAIAALVVSYNAALILFAFLQCIPLATLWTADPRGKCVPPRPAFVTLAIMNVVTDLMILVLPIRFVLRLQMKTVRKLQILGAFALGGIVTIFGAIRCYYVGKADTVDPSWTASDGAIWSQVEISVGIISACLPVYRPLLKQSKRRRPLAADYSTNGRSGKFESRSRSIPLTNNSSTMMAWPINTDIEGHYTEIWEPPTHVKKHPGPFEH